MSRQMITVRFSVPKDGDTLTRRVRNFGEELIRELTLSGGGVEEDPDGAMNEIRVTVSSRQHLASVSSTLNRVLEQHDLLEHAVVRKSYDED